MLPEQVVLEVLVVIVLVSIDSENITDIFDAVKIELLESDGEVDDIVGEIVSIINELILRVTLFPTLSLTLIVQSE